MAKPKTDYPALLMVKRGRGFLPATQDDAERVDSYREGDLFWMVVSPKDVPWQIKKCKAVIRHAVKNCNTPWDNVDAADAALKLAVGWVMSYEDIDGSWRAYPKSMMEFEDIEELEALCEKIYALLYQITGVDPDVIAAECWSPPRDTSSSAPLSSADDREPGEASPKPSTSPGPTSQASSAADRAPPESEPEGQFAGDDLSGAVEDLTTDEIEQHLGGQSQPITARSIVLHMVNFVGQRVSAGDVTPNSVKRNVDTLNDIARGSGPTFKTLSAEDQNTVKTAKALLMNHLELKQGFDWPSVRNRVSKATKISEEELEGL